MGNKSSCCQPRENSTQLKIAQKIKENKNKNEKIKIYIKINQYSRK